MIKFSATAHIDTQSFMRSMQRSAKATVLEAGAILEAEMKVLVPVDTGKLRDSIHIEERADGPFHFEVSVHPAELAGNKWGLDPAYARRIEYGFVGADSLGRMYHQAAQPYVRPAIDGKKNEVQKILKDGMQI